MKTKKTCLLGFIYKRKKSSGRKNSMAVRLVIGIVLGSAVGYAYYRFIGCSRGTCPLTSNPYISTIYGALVGAIASGAFNR